MRELLIETARASSEEYAPRQYQYTIIIDEMEVGAFSCESYGVKVTEPASGTSAAIGHITTSIQRIDSLIDLLIRNTVSPTTLADVVNDWL